MSLCLSFPLAYAQTQDDADPPDRAARLSLIQGEVSLQPAGEDQWATAIVNRPLTTGDKLWTDQGARAEIYVGPAAVRLGSNTGFSFLNVDDNTIQMRMTAGVMDVRVRDLDSNDHVEVDTPNLAVSLLRPGKYRVEVNDAGDTTVVKVSEGEAEATGGSQDMVVHAQQAVTFIGMEQLTAQTGSLGAPDEFDSWSLGRDRRDQQAASSQSAKYVSPEVTGYEDLDANGSWSSDPEYGNVWTPTVVAVDWSPYRYGRWAYVAPWGWTWIDDAPWGYAPFHYGRWARSRDRWCWVPGPREIRPVYAPALVGWVGTPGVSVSVTVGGGGGVAWFPLGPREVYVPARRYSPRYVERVNVSNTVIVNKTYITNVYENRVTNVTYRNRGVPGGVTSVSRTTFTSAESVGRHQVRVDDREITRVQATGMAPRIEPDRRSRMGVSPAARPPARTPPAAVIERTVVARRAPPGADAHFVRNVGAASPGRDQAERLHRMEPPNTQPGANQPNVRNGTNVPNNANGRGVANTPDNANARNDANRQQQGRDERPPQGQLRNDRPRDRSVIPDHVNRGPANDNPAARNEQPGRNDQPQQQRPGGLAERPVQEDKAAAADRIQAQRAQAERAQAERAQSDRTQADRAQAEQRAQADRAQSEQRLQAERQAREANQARADRPQMRADRGDQQRQIEQQRPQAQQDQQRQMERQQAQQDQQRQQAQQQAQMQRQQAQEQARQQAQQQAQQQQAQRAAAAEQQPQPREQNHMERRPEPPKQENKPQPQDRNDRRRPQDPDTRDR